MFPLRHKKFSCIIIVALVCLITQIYVVHCTPIIGDQAAFEDYSKMQGKSKPVLKFCDEIGNHLNCILYCKSMGHGAGHCGGDFICSCF